MTPTMQSEVRNALLTGLRKLLNDLEGERKQLREQYDVARNFACSSWTRDRFGELTVSEMHPQGMGLLRKNFDMLMSDVTRRKYLLIKGFMSILTPRDREQYADIIEYGDKHFNQETKQTT